MGKSQMIRNIHNACLSYKHCLLGNTYMFVYNNTYVEVMFKKSCFMHLTGVESNLSSNDFYKHALTKKGLKPSEIFFTNVHPYDLAVKKTGCLLDLYKITVEDSLISTDIETMTLTYAIGITNLEFVICLGKDLNSDGSLKSNCLIPYSFRVEEIRNNKYNGLYEVTHVFRKNTNQCMYQSLTFGCQESVKCLSVDIQKKLDNLIFG